MPKKYQNLLLEGDPARVYLLAYIYSTSAYKIAQILGKRSTEKVYKIKKKLVESGYLEHDKKNMLVTAKIEPLISEIRNILGISGTELTPLEQRFTIRLLESSQIRDIARIYYESYNEEHTNAPRLVCEILASMAGMALGVRRAFNAPKEVEADMRRLLKDFRDFETMTKLSEVQLKPVFQNYLPFKKILEPIDDRKSNVSENTAKEIASLRPWAFIVLPEAFLYKLVKLSPAGSNVLEILALGVSLGKLKYFSN